MNNPPHYILRWKGRQLGPFKLGEIEQKWDAHEIGGSHEIFYNDKWITLVKFYSEILPQYQPAPSQSPHRQAEPSPAAKTAQTESESANAVCCPGSTSTRTTCKPIRIDLQEIKARATNRADASRTKDSAAIQTSSPALAQTADGRAKRRAIYILLGIGLGFIGLHNIYAERYYLGMIQLFLTAVTLISGLGVILTWLWAFVEVIFVRIDGKGVIMK